MATPITFDPNFDMTPAYPGMLADAGFTDKVTVPCGAAAIAFGIVVGSTAAGLSVLPVGSNPEGVALHDHLVSGRVGGNDTYVQGDAIPVIKRGRVWARASGTCTKDAVAKYDPATGFFADAGTATLPNARFLSANLTVPAIATGGATSIMVLVELHNPTL